MQNQQRATQVLNCAEFVAGAASVAQIPEAVLPEFAFIGRSNVGKSSLINALVGRKALARVSQNPGCTKQINFFAVKNRLMLVDLPGYGFAKISNQERKMWDKLIHHYLRDRSTLRRVFVLLDSRHSVKDVDKDVMKLLDDYAVLYQLVMTKTDKSENLSIIKQEVEQLSTCHAACHPEVIWTSSRLKKGTHELQSIILE
jgi:GTP-binding protein